MTVGEHDLKGSEVPAARTENIKNMIVHPSYQCGRWSSDIALLELVKPIAWSESVKPACLPSNSERTERNAFDGKVAVIAGWGWLGENKSQGEYNTPRIFTDILQVLIDSSYFIYLLFYYDY